MESCQPGIRTPHATIEEDQEMKLKSKYPNMNKKGVNSLLLQKRLNKGHKYFDSGDYNMARAKVLQQKKSPLPPPKEEAAILQSSTGDTIPTPENVTAVRRKSLLLGEGSGPQPQCSPYYPPGAGGSPHRDHENSDIPVIVENSSNE